VIPEAESLRSRPRSFARDSLEPLRGAKAPSNSGGVGLRREKTAWSPARQRKVKLTVSHSIPADRERVFEALGDPAILRRCIPGCESLTASGPDTFEATLKIGVPGMKGVYAGTAAISDKHPPESLTLGFEGKGGPGFVRGSARIVLSSGEAATHVGCEADVQVGGLIAAVGSRLVEATARKLAGDFFNQLSKEMSATV